MAMKVDWAGVARVLLKSAPAWWPIVAAVMVVGAGAVRSDAVQGEHSREITDKVEKHDVHLEVIEKRLGSIDSRLAGIERAEQDTHETALRIEDRLDERGGHRGRQRPF